MIFVKTGLFFQIVFFGDGIGQRNVFGNTLYGKQAF